MTKLESTIIKLIMGITCPLFMLVIFFWLTGAFNIFVVNLPNSLNFILTFSGLITGCILDFLYLQHWTENFYTVNQRLAITIYFFLFIVAGGIFMGLPNGTFTLGIAAGLYTGRRGYHNQIDETQFALILRKVAFITASAMFAAALPIGILGLNEPVITNLFQTLFGIDKASTQGIIGYMLMGLFCCSLFIIQYWGSLTIGHWGFNCEKRKIDSSLQ